MSFHNPVVKLVICCIMSRNEVRVISFIGIGGNKAAGGCRIIINKTRIFYANTVTICDRSGLPGSGAIKERKEMKYFIRDKTERVNIKQIKLLLLRVTKLSPNQKYVGLVNSAGFPYEPRCDQRHKKIN